MCSMQSLLRLKPADICDIWSLQIIFGSIKQVICLARDKFWPDKKPVSSDKTYFSITCLRQLVLWSSNRIKTFHFCTQTLSYIVFTLDHKCPVTVSCQAKILPVKTWILAHNCPMTDCYLQPCLLFWNYHRLYIILVTHPDQDIGPILRKTSLETETFRFSKTTRTEIYLSGRRQVLQE